MPLINPYISLAFDLAILAALGAAIFYALRLSKQLRALQADRRAFDLLIQALNLSVSRAEGAVKNMKEAAQDSGDALQEKINAARALADELEIMVQAGDSLAGRLQKLAEKARAAPEPAAATAQAIAEEAAEPKPVRSRAEKELLEALKAKQS